MSNGVVYDPNGQLFQQGCYAGVPEHFNDPAYECVPNTGPLPRRMYRMTEFLNQYQGKSDVIRLQPENVAAMCGRGGFLIHGSNNPPAHTGSQGCIIVPDGVMRRKMWDLHPNARFINVVSVFTGS
jgi:hypothetical protein